MSRHATKFNKRDANEQIIVSALADMGVCWVESGPLDGWIFINRWIPVEIKNPDGLNKMRPSQEQFIRDCKLMARPWLVFRTTADAIEAVNALRR